MTEGRCMQGLQLPEALLLGPEDAKDCMEGTHTNFAMHVITAPDDCLMTCRDFHCPRHVVTTMPRGA